MGTCFVLYHSLNPSQNLAQNSAEKCITCIKNALDTTVNHFVATKNSILLDTSEDTAKSANISFKDIKDCHQLRICQRIQLVPNSFCSEHQAFQSTAMSQSQNPSQKASITHTFTKTFTPVGVWPPNNHHTASHQEMVTRDPIRRTQSSTSVSPAYNTIALVEFQSEIPGLKQCVSCLLQHTEVFFVFISDKASSGYVWMRQAPSLMF